MSSSIPNPYPTQNIGQSSPTLTAANAYRARQGQTRSNHGGQQVFQGHHSHNGSVTSNPSQPNQNPQQYGGEVQYWQFDNQYNFSATGSPGTLAQPTNIYSFEEDTSHHDPSLDDFLTTECSSENPLSEHTTPQELIWEQQFIPQDLSQPHILDAYGISQYSGIQGVGSGPDPHGIFQNTEQALPKFVSGEELLGPKFTTSRDPSQVSHNSTREHLSMASSLTPPPSHKKGNSQSLKVNTGPNQTPPPNQYAGSWSQNNPNNPAPSPVVMVSSYDTGDASRYSHEQQVQGTGKRSRGSDSSNDNDEDDENTDFGSGPSDMLSSHLMPPDVDDVATIRPAPSRTGLDPSQRNEDHVYSVKDLGQQRERDEKNAEVQSWLAASDAGSDSEDKHVPHKNRQRSQAGRNRAHTTGAQTDALGRVYPDRGIPGPGVLVDVDSDDDYSDDASVTSSQQAVATDEAVTLYHESGSPQMSPRALAAVESPEQSSFPALDDDTPPELQEPLPRQFYKRGPWHDPVKAPDSNTRDQPGSSNAAAYKYNQEAAKWETASRAATWGTRRRLSDSEVKSIVEGSQVRHLSLSKRGRERGNSILNKARGLLPRRSSSNIKTETATNEKEPATTGHAHRSSVGAVKPAHRKSSFTKPRSSPVDTGGAIMAMSGQLAAIGRTNTRSQDTEAKPSRPLPSLKKQRSKSDVSKKSGNPGLAELMTRHGGPPVPTLASPMHERESILAAQVLDNEDQAGDDDDDDQADEVGIRMDLEIRADEIVTTLEGFKDHARKLNPRLEPYLIDRIGQEQIRRYKKLVETKIKHIQSVQQNKCSSRSFCFDLGGEAVLLAPRVSSKDPEATLTQFQVNNSGDHEIDESGFTEGIVTPALFPPGIPLPPVKRLPAEFECQLCFRVKKFSKPSDWTKHVHEDIQPFSCTFPNCAESKSFKRKADWVRHENERHRHLEWWKCSHQECAHVCYRKDNFVQHLVREHKMTEPKNKGRGSNSSKNKPVNSAATQASQEDSELWRMVDDCRFETTSKARDEHCRFCGNVCTSFKKLSVHMGKHMEQIAMPVLELVSMRQVTSETIISPIEQPPPVSSFVPMSTTMNNGDSNNLSPYPASAVSAYQTSSAGQSPASMHGRVPNSGFNFEQGYYSPHSMQGGMITSTYGASQSFHNQNSMYMDGSDYMGNHGSGRQEHSLSPQHQLVTPRSQPMAPAYSNAFFDPTGVSYNQAPMQAVYANSSSSAGFIPQYAPPMLQDRHSHSPMGVDSHQGLGLQPTGSQQQRQQQQQQQYGYGAPAGRNGQTLQYS